MDKRTSGELRKQLTKRGVEFKLNTSIDAINDKTVNFSDGETKEFDAVLIAVGRSPLTENIGLDNVNIVSENGFINVDLDTFETSVENIFALGDIVNNTPQLAHAAFAEAISAITYIASGEKKPLDYKAIPYVVYTRPELAEIGLNAEKAKLENIDIEQSQHLSLIHI